MNGVGRRQVALGALAIAVSLAAVGGCRPRQMLLNRQDLGNGLIIVLPGIDGRALHNEGVCHALRDQGLAVELYDWTMPFGLLYNQCAVGRNRNVAAGLAGRIARYRRGHPNSPVFLVAHSGGTAIAAWAAEALPAGLSINGIIMLASSLSPGYDLAPALSRADLGIVSFYSKADLGLLGAGTSMFGTMDRRYTEGAGKVGFAAGSLRADSGAYRKLFQIPWVPKMARTGYLGGHFSCCSKRFIAAYVGGLIRARAWNPKVMAALAGEGTAIASAAGAGAGNRGPTDVAEPTLAAGRP